MTAPPLVDESRLVRSALTHAADSLALARQIQISLARFTAQDYPWRPNN